MRILHTVEFYHPAVGGAERVVQRISEGLAARGHQVLVATSEDPRRTGTHAAGVHIVPFRISGNHARRLRGDVERYKAWLRSEGFDVILNYAAQSWPTDAMLPLLGEIAGVKILATCGFSGLHGLRRPLYWSYFRMLAEQIREYDGLIFHGQTGVDASFGRRHGRGDSVVIANGADGREFDAAEPGFRARHGIQSRFMLLHVGNHHNVKGHRDLIRLLDTLHDLDVTLVLIGEGASGGRSCWDACARAARRDDRLRLLHSLPRSDVVAAFREGDLFLLPSRFEAAPLVLVEAMAGGLPFVSYDVGNAGELAGGVVVRGFRQMTAAVRTLLNDGSRREVLGRAGREMQRRALEWEHLIDRYEAFYAQLMKGKAFGHRA